MAEIRSGLAEGQHTFEFALKGVTIPELKIYCRYAKYPLEKFEMEEGSHYVPGHYFIGLFRYMVPEISKKDSLFPLTELHSWSISTNGTFENRILLHEDIIVKMQKRTREKEKEWFWIEFVRKSDNKIVLAGIFGFIGERRKDH